MAINFRKRIKLPNGMIINMGKKGMNSMTMKVGGMSVNIGKDGNIFANLNYGNGMTERKKINKKKSVDKNKK